jgi:predicted permease
MLAGLLPVARLWRVPLDRSLKAGGGRTSTGRRRGWTLLVAAQIAVAVALLFTATALTRSFLNLLNAPLGFSPDRVWTGAIQLADRGPGSRAASADFFERLTTRLAALPGVESASAGGQIPFNPGGVQIMNVVFPGRPVPDVRPAAEVNIVLPGYFRTLRIPRLEGRTFASQDAAGAPAVAVVDRTFARTYFANEDPIGQLVSSATTTYRIIGVVAPVADADLAAVPRPQIYLSERQEGQSATFLVVREAPGQDVTAMVRAQLRAMDPTVALFDVSPMSDRVASSIRLRRFVAWLLNGFAAMGLLLAALGLYGTLAHTVEARRREIAIRVALGAHAGRVRRLVARQGVRLAVAGLVPGLALAAAGGRITRAFLFGVAPFDPWTIFGTTAAVLLLAFAASWIPAARAARVDALAALREE